MSWSGVVPVSGLEAAVRALDEDEARRLGRSLVRAAHGVVAAGRPRCGAVLHELGCVVLDHGDGQRWALEALADDLDEDEAEGGQVGPGHPDFGWLSEEFDQADREAGEGDG